MGDPNEDELYKLIKYRDDLIDYIFEHHTPIQIHIITHMSVNITPDKDTEHIVTLKTYLWRIASRIRGILNPERYEYSESEVEDWWYALKLFKKNIKKYNKGTLEGTDEMEQKLVGVKLPNNTIKTLNLSRDQVSLKPKVKVVKRRAPSQWHPA